MPQNQALAPKYAELARVGAIGQMAAKSNVANQNFVGAKQNAFDRAAL